jgi:hypothetical protein
MEWDLWLTGIMLVVAVQCVSVGFQRHGRAVCAYGEFEDPVQSAE